MDEKKRAIFGDDSYEPAAPQADKVFLPWHRPRKQFVRRAQWAEQINRMVQDDYRGSCQTLSYMGLPGDDLLDVRFIHDEVCAPKEITFKYLGFNTNARSEVAPSASGKELDKMDLSVSLDEVSKLPFIDPRSQVCGDNIRHVARDTSLANRYMLQHGTFDIVNYDLCDGVASLAPGAPSDPNYIESIDAIVNMQSKHRRPWLLFLTTCVNKTDVNEDVYLRLMNLLRNNIENCDGFRGLFLEKISAEFPDEAEIDAWADGDFSKVLLVAICKWVCSRNASFNPPVEVKLRSVLGYPKYYAAKHVELVSIVLHFSPENYAVQDMFGLSNLSGRPVDECSSAKSYLDRISKLQNVDEIFSSCGDIRESMEEETVKLLEKARYEADDVREWIRQGCPSDYS